MHRVVRQHVEDFSKRFETAPSESKAFEAFVNYITLRKHSADEVTPQQLIYEGADPGIDGFSVVVDDSYVGTVEELDEVLQRSKREFDVVIIFCQSKTSESWTKSEINTFQSAILDFLREDSKYPHSEYLKNAKELFDKIIGNVGRIRGGKPRVECYFATTAGPVRDVEIAGALDAIRDTVSDSGLFSQTTATGLDRDQIVNLWLKADGPVEATLTVIQSAAFPKTPGVDESYVATAKALDFVNALLIDENQTLRRSIFEENVRDFIGVDEEINSEIASTLAHPDKQKRFGMLNNGITIVSPDVRVQGYEIFLRDYQIVNGCQTSHILYENLSHLSPDVTVTLKIIETSDPAIVDDIVRSTNRQTKVQDDQFLATLDSVKAIERYFVARGAEEEYKLLFERRKNQFSHEIVASMRVFDIREIARCAGAMFFDRPELASRYPNRLTGELQDTVFQRENIEDIYYTAAFASYRLRLHFSNKRIEPKFGKLKWHLLMAIKYPIAGEGPTATTSNKVKKLCSEIDKFMSDGSEENVQILNSLAHLFEPVEEITRDRLKGQQFTAEARKMVLDYRKSVSS